MKAVSKVNGPKKKMVKPAKRVAQRKVMAAEEKYDNKMNKMMNKSLKKPAGIADAMNKAKEGYSKIPRVKPSKKR